MSSRWVYQLIRILNLKQGWLDETAESLKSLDSNHLVTYSSEGFLGSSTPGDIRSFQGPSSVNAPHDVWPLCIISLGSIWQTLQLLAEDCSSGLCEHLVQDISLIA